MNVESRARKNKQQIKATFENERDLFVFRFKLLPSPAYLRPQAAACCR